MTSNGSKDPRIASIDEARRRKAELAKSSKVAASVATSGSIGQRVFAALMIVMAAGFVAWIFGAFGAVTTPAGVSQ